jgi:DNA-binding LacI/PurR family transcriptional regulator
MLFEEFSGNSVKEILAKVKAALASTLEEMGVDGVISTPKSDSEFYDSLAITIPVVVKSRVRVWVKLLFSRSIYDETEDWRDRGGNWRAIVSEIK